MDDCIFCKVVANKTPSYTIYEDKHVKAFLDIFGKTDGHTVVVLKRHGETILDYSGEELKNLWEGVQKVAGALQKAFHTTVLSIGINHGEPAGVHHLHVHVIPRYKNDAGGIMQSLPTRARKEDFSVVLEKVRGCL